MIVKLRGGVGNQLFQYAFGRSLSVARNEPVYFDKTDYLNTLFSGWFRLNDWPTLTEYRADGVKRGCTDSNFFWEPTLRFIPEVFTMPSNTNFHGYWQTEKYFKGIEHEIRGRSLHRLARCLRISNRLSMRFSRRYTLHSSASDGAITLLRIWQRISDVFTQSIT